MKTTISFTVTGLLVLAIGCGTNPSVNRPDDSKPSTHAAKSEAVSSGSSTRPTAESKDNAHAERPDATSASNKPGGTRTRSAAASRTKFESPPSANSVATANQAGFQPDHRTYSQIVTPFLKSHCLNCHGPKIQESDFRVDRDLPNDFRSRAIAEKWSEVLNMLNTGDMPPAGERQPEAEAARQVVEWIEHERVRAERTRRDRAIVLRRMNREEYNNTIRDLIGIDFRLIEEFPEDPPAGGFDNNGNALTISPFHLELYLKAAQKILDRAIVEVSRGPGTIKWHVELDGGREGNGQAIRFDDGHNRNVRINASSRPRVNGMVVMRHPAEPWTGVQFFTVSSPGEYVIRVRAAGAIPPEADVRHGGPEVHELNQQERERKINDIAKRRESRERYEKWTIPYVRQHFKDDWRYRYGPPRLRLDGVWGGNRSVLAAYDVTAPATQPQVYETRAFLPAEKASLRLSNEYHVPEAGWFAPSSILQHDKFPRPELLIDWVEIEGPIYDDWPPTSHKRILIDSPNKGGDEAVYARDVLANFMPRAWRRPLRNGELEPMVALFEKVRGNKPSFEEAIKVPLMAVLASPHFVYLVEVEQAATGTAELPRRRLNNYELAARLSYLLWSSMPDDELFQLARTGKLNDRVALRAEVDRMLADKKSDAFVKNFTGQWLRLREVGFNPPTRDLYTRYDDHLEVSMRGESEAFFAHILHNDRTALDLLSSDYVTINERLARFYGIPGVKGDHFRPVKVAPRVPRGGLVTQASILSITSNGTRTSPVWRGVWILTRLLGDPPPPPPPNANDIPPRDPNTRKVPLRAQLRMHREQQQCARCHNKIDPLGFALENFAASGEWRDKESRKYYGIPPSRNDPGIDAKAQLPDGTEFVGVDGLRRELIKRKNAFLHCLAEKLYSYALGRELGYADQPVVDNAAQYMEQHGTTLRSLIHHVVTSELFRSK